MAVVCVALLHVVEDHLNFLAALWNLKPPQVFGSVLSVFQVLQDDHIFSHPKSHAEQLDNDVALL